MTNASRLARAERPTSESPRLGHGVGLRRDHFERVLDEPTQVDWFEVLSENFMQTGGRPMWVLDQVTERDPGQVLHRVVEDALGRAAVVVDRHRVRVGQLAGGLHLALESHRRLTLDLEGLSDAGQRVEGLVGLDLDPLTAGTAAMIVAR